MLRDRVAASGLQQAAVLAFCCPFRQLGPWYAFSAESNLSPADTMLLLPGLGVAGILWFLNPGQPLTDQGATLYSASTKKHH